MKYYVNSKNKFGKTFEAPNDVVAVAFGEGYGYAKGWEWFRVYCRDTGKIVVCWLDVREPKKYKMLDKDFIDWQKELFNAEV